MNTVQMPIDKTRRKRLKVISACGECRRKKTKCNGEKPCSGCIKANVDCKYSNSPKSRPSSTAASVQRNSESQATSSNSNSNSNNNNTKSSDTISSIENRLSVIEDILHVLLLNSSSGREHTNQGHRSSAMIYPVQERNMQPHSGPYYGDVYHHHQQHHQYQQEYHHQQQQQQHQQQRHHPHYHTTDGYHRQSSAFREKRRFDEMDCSSSSSNNSASRSDWVAPPNMIRTSQPMTSFLSHPTTTSTSTTTTTTNDNSNNDSVKLPPLHIQNQQQQQQPPLSESSSTSTTSSTCSAYSPKINTIRTLLNEEEEKKVIEHRPSAFFKPTAGTGRY